MVDKYKIHPKLKNIAVDLEWTSGKNDRRWAKSIAIYLEDETLKKGIFRRKSEEIGEIFYLLVCSEEFRINPDPDWKDEEFDKAIIQEVYSHDQILEYVRNIVNNIGTVSVDEFEQIMRKTFDMSDWDQIDELIPNSD